MFWYILASFKKYYLKRGNESKGFEQRGFYENFEGFYILQKIKGKYLKVLLKETVSFIAFFTEDEQ